MSAGFQLANIYFLLAESQHSDLWETVVQVALALQLIFYGYMAKHIAVGATLLLMHDACDVLTSACKALVHTTYKVSTFMGAMVLMVAWAYIRLYCLANLILIPMLKVVEEKQPWKGGDVESLLFTVLLLSLFFMNIYWLVMTGFIQSSLPVLFFQVFTHVKICDYFCEFWTGDRCSCSQVD